MCKFCDELIKEYNKIHWLTRSVYADNNICEFVNNYDCELCDECTMDFTISSYNINGDTYVGLEYHQHLMSKNNKEVIIFPFTESMQWNYCPICGKQISKNINKSDQSYAIEYDK